MADISITSTLVVAASDAQKVYGTAGATITAGKSVYLNTSTSRYEPADADEEAKALVAGIALNDAVNGQPLAVLTDGDITIGGTVVKGTPYFVSTGAGGICPFGDLASGDYVSYIGTAKTTGIISVKRHSSGVAI